MVDEVDKLSDSQIRTRLAEFGFPMVPITATTRKTMIKKLKMLIENQNKVSNANRLSLSKYSSGEESDIDNNKNDNRRLTTAGGAMSPPSALKKGKINRSHIMSRSKTPPNNDLHKDNGYSPTSGRRSYVKNIPFESEIRDNNEVKSSSDENSHFAKPRRSTRFSKPSTSLQYGDSVSDSDEEVNKQISSSQFSPKPNSTSLFSNESISINPGNNYRSSNFSSRYYSGSETNSRDNKYDSEINVDSRVNDSSDKVSSLIQNYESPFLSEFTRRLETTKRLSIERPIVRADDIPQSPTLPSRSDTAARNNFDSIRANISRRIITPPSSRSHSAIDNLFKKSNIIPAILICILITFFLGVTFMYLGIKGKKPFTVESKDHNLPICHSTIPNKYTQENSDKPGINCVPEGNIRPALKLCKYLLPEISRRAVEHHCGDASIPAFMTNSDVVDFVRKDNYKLEPQQILADLDNLHVLVMKNAQWGLSIIDKNLGTDILNLEDMAVSKDDSNLGISIKNPDIPLSCYFYNKIYSIMYAFVIIVSVSGILYSLQYFISYHIKRREEQNREVFAMVEQIIDILQEAGSEEDESSNFMAVNHVRDRIIQPHQRKGLNKTWDDAVKFLEENESRVRSEVQNVSGEDFKVWRWLAAGSHNTSPSCPKSKNKVWQGQAFETQEGSVNNLPVSPTPCLKIRHMIDQNDDLQPSMQTVIQDAILDKCGEECRILHVHIDPQYYCVYVKCASQKDAGIAYRSLHGCWFDGKLVTVKYVRLERYMERFPRSSVNGPYLRPSNNKKTSLQFKRESNEN